MKSLSGFICLHRKLLDWEWHNDPNTFTVFIHLLLLASWKDTEWRGIPIKRGQLITSRSSMSKETGLTERKVRTAEKHLEKTGEVTIKATKQYTLITVVNYELYQGGGEKNDQGEDQQATSGEANDRPTESPSVDHILKKEKENNEKKERAVALHSQAFTPPTVEDVAAYCFECGYQNDAQKFVDYYTARGWKMNGGLPMEDWRAAVRMWMNREKVENRADKGEEVDWKFGAV